jgi:hypothetical protein
MFDLNDKVSDQDRHPLAERLQFGLVLVATFVCLLTTELVALLLPWTWWRKVGSDDSCWLIGRTWNNAARITDIAFTA